MSDLGLNEAGGTAGLNVASIHMMNATTGFALTADGKAYFTNDGFVTASEQSGIGTIEAVVISEGVAPIKPLLLNSSGKLYK
jgi:hypothetical protein